MNWLGTKPKHGQYMAERGQGRHAIRDVDDAETHQQFVIRETGCAHALCRNLSKRLQRR
jgi:hypothetical protein